MLYNNKISIKYQNINNSAVINYWTEWHTIIGACLGVHRAGNLFKHSPSWVSLLWRWTGTLLLRQSENGSFGFFLILFSPWIPGSLDQLVVPLALAGLLAKG